MASTMDPEETAEVHRWLVEHFDELAPYRGEWVVLLHRRVVAHGEDLASMVRRFREDHPGEVPFAIWVPDGRFIAPGAS